MQQHVNNPAVPRKERTRARKEKKYYAWQIMATAEEPDSQGLCKNFMRTADLHTCIGARSLWNMMTSVYATPFAPAAWWGPGETLEILVTHEFHKFILDSYSFFNLYILQLLSLAATAELLSWNTTYVDIHVFFENSAYSSMEGTSFW